MHLLLDSDSLCYRAGFAANEPGQEALAIWQLDKMVEGVLNVVKPDSQQLYLSGSGNFRFAIYPEYKGNRKSMARPTHLQALREHLVGQWGATVSDGIEADDQIGIDVYRALDEVVIGHIDKDLDMLAGRHYNYTKDEWYDVSEQEAMRHFFYQLIMGDRADNIPGFDGKMRHKVPNFLASRVECLEWMHKDQMLEHVVDMYNDFNKFELSARCLWLQRSEGDEYYNWQNLELLEFLRREHSLTEEHGQQDALTASLLLPSEQLPDDGPLNSPF